MSLSAELPGTGVARALARGTFLSLSLFWAACGSPPTEHGGAEASLESFGLLTADAVCTLAFECCAASQRADLPQTESECRASMAAELDEEVLPVLRAAVKAGQLRYDGARYEGCLKQIVSAGCGTARRYVECIDVGLEALVPSGGVCRAHAHCAEGACVGATASTAGVCGAPLEDGLGCASALECASKSCVGGVCRKRAGLGHSCYADSECESERCDTLARVCSTPSATMCP